MGHQRDSLLLHFASESLPKLRDFKWILQDNGFSQLWNKFILTNHFPLLQACCKCPYRLFFCSIFEKFLQVNDLRDLCRTDFHICQYQRIFFENDWKKISTMVSNVYQFDQWLKGGSELIRISSVSSALIEFCLFNDLSRRFSLATFLQRLLIERETNCRVRLSNVKSVALNLRHRTDAADFVVVPFNSPWKSELLQIHLEKVPLWKSDKRRGVIGWYCRRINTRHLHIEEKNRFNQRRWARQLWVFVQLIFTVQPIIDTQNKQLLIDQD